MANSTLSAIRTKVRRLTRTPSESLLPNDVIDEYINTFIQYDFPQNILNFQFETNVVFSTLPNISTYYLNDVGTITISGTTYPRNVLSDFWNIYTSIEPPIYANGQPIYYSQSQEEFFNSFPNIQITENIGTGDGLTKEFSGTLSTVPILQQNTMFTAVDPDGGDQTYISQTRLDTTYFQPLTIENLYEINRVGNSNTLDATNNIDISDGEYIVTFANAPDNGAVIKATYTPVTLGPPSAMLLFDNQLILRPAPDDVYQINFTAMKRPINLINANQSPLLKQSWQYIAYGAAKKIFEDRMDAESLQAIFPEYDKQERLVLRMQIKQQQSQRTPTIYAGYPSYGRNYNFFYNGF